MLLEFAAIAAGLLAVGTAGRMHRLPPAGVIFIFGFFAYVYAGSLLAGADLVAAGMTTQPYLQMLALVRTSFWIAVAMYLVVSLVVPQAKVEELRPAESLDRYQLGALHVMGVLCLLANIVYIIVLPGNPFAAMFGDSMQVAYLREEATTAFRLFPLFSAWLSFITPFVFLLYWFAARSRLAIGLLVVNTMALLVTGQKAPLVYSLLALALAVGLRNRQFPWFKAAIGGVLAISLLVVIVVLQNFNIASLGIEWSYLLTAWDAIVARVVSVGSRIVYGYVEYFPAQMDFYYLDPPENPVDQLVFRHLFPGVDIQGTANAAFVASLYGAFGGVPLLLYGAIAISLALLFLGERLCLHQRPTVFTLATYVMLCLAALKMCITNLSTVWLPVLLFLATTRGLMLLLEAGFRWLDDGVLGARARITVVIPSLLITAYVFQGWVRNLV